MVVPVRVLAIAESPSPLVIHVEVLPMPHISRMELATPPQCPTLLAPPLLPYNPPRADEMYRYKLILV